MITADEIRRWVERFDPGGDRRAEESCAAVLALLEQEAWPGDRSSFAPGHVTASGLVLTPSLDAVLLVFHPRLHRWLQPGGHLERSDRSVVDAARREVCEETGLTLSGAGTPALVSVDVHDIPAHATEPAHRHHDLMFGFVASDGAALAPGMSAAWHRLDRLHEVEPDPPLRNAIHRVVSGRSRPG